MKTKMVFSQMPKSYRGLLALHAPRPIHDNIEYENALEILEAMAGHEMTHDQDDYFEALAILVEAYEGTNFPGFPAKRGLTLLRHLMNENQMSAADLARLIGADRSMGVKIMNGDLNLTLEHMKKLAKRFMVPDEISLR